MSAWKNNPEETGVSGGRVCYNPWNFLLRNKVVTLVVDIFFVDGISFLLTLSCQIKSVTDKYTPVRIAKKLVKHLKQVL